MMGGEFIYLFFFRLEIVGLFQIKMVVYIDDNFLAATNFAILLRARAFLDGLADELGVAFKDSKEEGFSKLIQVLSYWVF